MAEIGPLPSLGQKPWNLNPALQAINAELEGRLSEANLNGRYPVYRVWDGDAYPTRVPDSVNIFIGGPDPGLAMGVDDLWINPDSATMAAVVAAMLNPSSALATAARSSVTRTVDLAIGLPNDAFTDPITAASLSRAVMSTFGSSPNQLYAWRLAKGGTNALRVTGRVPEGWSGIKLHVMWIHDSGSGAARISRAFRLANASGVVASESTTGNFTSTGSMKLNDTVFEAPVIGGTYLSGSIARISDNADDTISGAIGVVGVWMERVA